MLPLIASIAGPLLAAASGGGSGAGAAAAMDPTKMGDIDLNQGYYGDAKIVFGPEENNKTWIIIAVIAGAAVLLLIGKK